MGPGKEGSEEHVKVPEERGLWRPGSKLSLLHFVLALAFFGRTLTLTQVSVPNVNQTTLKTQTSIQSRVSARG